MEIDCTIQIHQTDTGRTRCYDTHGPFFGILPRMRCQTHNTTFLLTSTSIWSQLDSALLDQSLVFFASTVMTVAFVEQVYLNIVLLVIVTIRLALFTRSVLILKNAPEFYKNCG